MYGQSWILGKNSSCWFKCYSYYLQYCFQEAEVLAESHELHNQLWKLILCNNSEVLSDQINNLYEAT